MFARIMALPTVDLATPVTPEQLQMVVMVCRGLYADVDELWTRPSQSADDVRAIADEAIAEAFSTLEAHMNLVQTKDLCVALIGLGITAMGIVFQLLC